MSVGWYRRWLCIVLAVVVVFGGGYCWKVRSEEIKEQEASVSEMAEDLLIPGGMPIGIYMETDGVMVLGTQEIEGKDGSRRNPAKHLVREGDYIVGIDSEKIANAEELVERVRKLSNNSVILHIRRKKEYIDIQLHPIEDEVGAYKLGIWVRDSAQGLGTITFLNADSEYGALGHGIHDVDTGKLIEMADGRIYDTSIQNIKRGENGNPGGMEGIIVYNRYNILGTITKNSETGIYGKIDKIDRLFEKKDAFPAALKEEVEVGNAKIRCTVNGKIEEYGVKITKVSLNAREVNQGIEIQVTDEKLLKITGGIVQGMSGSPIMQNGKIVGAVTHVFVQDATKGYGIFIENMLENLKKD